jgi:hypothetical protein
MKNQDGFANQFHIISIQKRLADHAFSNAHTWPELQRAHQTWWTNYNAEHHYAHIARQDGRHSPSAVLRGVLGRTYPPEVLSRVLYATQFTRSLDKHGYLRFQDWKLYGERGLAYQPVSVWMYENTLKVEYQAVTLSTYRVERRDDHKRVTQVESPRVTETIFRSPQLALFDLGPDEWLLYWKAPSYLPRRRHAPLSNITQLVLFEVLGEAKAAGAETAPPLLRLVRARQEHEQE